MVRTWFSETFASLSEPRYRVLWAGTSLSFLAFSMSMIVQSVVAFDLTKKNGSVGFVQLGMGIATIISAPFGGVIADRVSKRVLLLIGQTIISANFGLVGVLIITGHITIPILFTSTLIQGLVFSFIAPARQAWLGELLSGPLRANGIALQQVAMTATRIFGPFLAGALIALAFVGPGGAYLAMGAIMLLVVATLAQLPPSPPNKAAGSTAMSAFMDGVRHVSARPRLALLTTMFVGVVIGGFSYQVLLAGYLEHELGHDRKDMAWMLGVAGFAGLITTVLVAGRASSPRAWQMMVGSALVLGASLIALAAVGSFAGALVVMLALGAGSSVFQMINSALVLQESDPAYFGRVASLTMLAWGFNSLVGLPFGALADHIGERETLMLMGAIVIGVTIAASGAHVAIGRRVARVPVPSLARSD
ncbi:MAG: MFS transporter [Dehalococcoidia bacterium]